MKRRYRTIHLYLTKEFLFSFLVSFLFFFIIFFVNQILLLAERVLSNRIPLGYVLRLILCTFPSILALSFPFATLVGALMALGSLSSQKEILAMECVGISLRTLSVPILAVGILFCCISFYINDYLLPLGAVHYRRISREIFTAMPSLELEPYSVKFIDNRVVVTSDVDENHFGPILIIENSRKNERTLIMSPSGHFENHPDKLGNFSIIMDDVEQHTVDNRERLSQTYTRAELFSMNFLFSSVDGTSKLSPTEIRSFDLIKQIREKQEAYDSEIESWEERVEKAQAELDEAAQKLELDGLSKDDRAEYQERKDKMAANLEAVKRSRPRDRTLDQWRMEYFQKFAIPFSCFPFVLLAFPLGVVSRRSGRAVGFLIGLFLAFLYWAFLIMGRNLTMRSGVSPFLSIWMANILLSVVGAFLYYRKVKG
ncbi:MAG: LptF/LptG family permease [Spirochaetales bacterium]|nr:LptF/LptG family permease [Spirochaetales bacterium]